MFPEGPCAKNDMRIKPLPRILFNIFQDFLHQSAKDVVRWVGTRLAMFRGWRILNKNSWGNTGSEDVLNVFILLITKGTMI
jgi:hypothetical protein